MFAMKGSQGFRTASPLALASAAVLVAGGCGGAAGAQDNGAEDFAGDTVRMIVPMAVGGGFDTTIRQLQEPIEDHLDTQMTVENMEGGATAIGTQAAATADGDCMTLLVSGVPHFQF